MKITVAELAERLAVEYQVAYGLVSYLRAKGLVKELGKRKPTNGSGRGSTEYEVPERVELVFIAETRKPVVTEETPPAETAEPSDKGTDVVVAA